MLRITLGLALDGERSCAPANHLGAPTLAPQGLLNLLEAQLGLTRDWPSHAERVIQYRDCLKRCHSPQRFYHKTFALDELGTGATLLRWRDLWYLHGWSGSTAASKSLRLRDMGDVEAIARDNVSPSVGMRLQAIHDTLLRRQPPIDEITLVDRMESFPSQWQRVLRLFRIRETRPLADASGLGFLGDLQRAVLAVQQGQTPTPIAWRDDGTVAIFRAETRLLGSRWLAERLRDQTDSTLLVAGTDGALLDETLVGANLARHGFRDASEFRPSLQLLPLAMSILWEPLDFYALLAFLTHPISPIPRYARWRLVGKVAERPGIGGELWERTLEDIAEHYGEKAPETRASIKLWLEHERYPTKGGAPVQIVQNRAGALCDFLRKRLHDDDIALADAHGAGLSQVSAFLNALELLANQGVLILPRTLLVQLIAQVASVGKSNSLLQAEVGCLSVASDPAAVIEPVHTVVWWQLASPATIRRSPWSQKELADLTQCGVALPSAEQLLAQAAETWTRPIRAAHSRLELVLPPEGVEVHPVWLMLKSLVTGMPVRQLEGAMLAREDAAVTPVGHRPLPSQRRWWQLPPNVAIPRREGASFTSLNALLNGPYHWVLQYAAHLRPSNILAVSDGPLLCGMLAHRLMERAFGSADALRMTDATFETWLEDAVPAILAEEGAVLLMPGRKADLARFRAQIRGAFGELRAQLARAHVVNAVAEMKLSGPYVGGKLGGSADLVVETVDHKRGILDMKWGGAWPRKLLSENRHLQLAVYAELVRQQTGAWPEVAYVLLAQGQLIARTDSFFPGAETIRTTSDETTAHLWRRFLASWRWRMKQIDAGRIEVVVDDIEETAESASPKSGLVVEALNPLYSNFTHLIGWEASAL